MNDCVFGMHIIYSFILLYLFVQLQHRLTDEGVYPAVAESIAECLSVRRDELRQQLIQSSCAISHAHLVDFDWQVKVKILCVLRIRILYN